MIYNIPAHLPFAEYLVKGLFARHRRPQEVVLYLPSQQAKQAFCEAMIAHCRGNCLFLPRLYTIGEIEEEEPTATISDHRQRLLAVAELLADKKLPPHRLFELASEFLTLYDSALLNQVPLASIKTLAAESKDGWAEHWRKLLNTLRVISSDYPNLLKKRELVDPRAMEVRTLQARTRSEHLREGRPIVVAGATGGDIAVYKRFICKIAAEDSVVLPGLDMEMDEETWRELAANHPQYAMRRLLDEIPRSRVKQWVEDTKNEQKRRRMRILRRAMRPSKAPADGDGKSLAGVSLITAEDERQEAALIALGLLRALAQGKKAALITRDRPLARMVAAELANYSHPVNDAAGIPLARTDIVKFLSLLLQCLRVEEQPSAIIAFLSNPLNEKSRLGERQLALVREKTGARDFLEIARRLKKPPKLVEKLTFVHSQLSRLKEALQKPTPLHELLTLHLRAAEALAPNLWQNRHGEEVATVFQELLRAAKTSQLPLEATTYPQAFQALLAGDVVRPKAVLGAKLLIWSSMHARFQKLDLAILGGLSEGSWPPSIKFNPWLSRGMMKELGLGDAQTRIGLAAHDFMQCFGAADEVILSTAKRRDYRPLAPSRWLERLKHLLPPQSVSSENELPQILKKRGEIKVKTRRLPDFALPKGADIPDHFRLTDLSSLKTNPYIFYVKAVLRLREQQQGGNFYQLRGTLVHELAKQYAETQPSAGQLDKMIDKILLPLVASHASDALFLEAFLRSFADGLLDMWGENRRFGEVFAEIKGEAKLGDYLLRTKADRIEKTPDGLIIADFKTGSMPTGKAIGESLEEPQLPLMAHVAQQNGFTDLKLKSPEVSEVFYLKVAQDEPITKAPKSIKKSKTALTGEELQALVAKTVQTYQGLLDAHLKNAKPFTASGDDKYLSHIIRFQECIIP